jgi:methionyl-tRNA synthetase
MAKKIYYLTTPLYYVNDKPHIGHAYTTIVCDTLARYRRFLGEEVFFLTGTDEHGGKIDKTAREKGQTVEDYVALMVPRFKDLWSRLGISYDDFIRTTEERHKSVVQSFLTKLQEKGDIYRDRYRGWYCTPCESFWKAHELAEGKCPDCKRAVQELEEENFFFKMSKYQAWLRSHIESHPDFIHPSSRRKEILAFLDNPLEDLCVSRPRARLAWGISFPGSPDHVVYVWFDALINYVSAAMAHERQNPAKHLWPADLHVVGKDILRQHTVYWPIMLKALELEIPVRVLAHGWWTVEGAKVSKSVGNVVDPVAIVEKYGVDPLRYFLLREVTLGLDGSYSEDLLQERFTNDLANDLGNLIHRSFGMLGRYFDGVLPKEVKAADIANPLREEGGRLHGQVREAMGALDPRGAMEAIWAFVRGANKFVEVSKPWVLAKDPAKGTDLARVMYTLFESLRVIGVILNPFLPETSGKILAELALPTSASAKEAEAWGLLPAGHRVGKSEPLFPRAEFEAS